MRIHITPRVLETTDLSNAVKFWKPFLAMIPWQELSTTEASQVDFGVQCPGNANIKFTIKGISHNAFPIQKQSCGIFLYDWTKEEIKAFYRKACELGATTAIDLARVRKLAEFDFKGTPVEIHAEQPPNLPEDGRYRR
jgi:hypothetical protein